MPTARADSAVLPLRGASVWRRSSHTGDTTRKPCLHDLLIQIATVGQDHLTYSPSIPINVPNPHSDSLAEHQSRRELFGSRSERLLALGSVHTVESHPDFTPVAQDTDRVAIRDGYYSATEIFGKSE